MKSSLYRPFTSYSFHPGKISWWARMRLSGKAGERDVPAAASCRPWSRTAEGSTSAVSGAMEGEVSVAKGICRFPIRFGPSQHLHYDRSYSILLEIESNLVFYQHPHLYPHLYLCGYRRQDDHLHNRQDHQPVSRCIRLFTSFMQVSFLQMDKRMVCGCLVFISDADRHSGFFDDSAFYIVTVLSCPFIP